MNPNLPDASQEESRHSSGSSQFFLGGLRGGFMVAKHAQKRKGALHDPAGKNNACLRLG